MTNDTIKFEYWLIWQVIILSAPGYGNPLRAVQRDTRLIYWKVL